MWFFIYGQVVQADACSMRNILLATSLGVFLRPIREGLGSQLSVLLKNFTGSTIATGPHRLSPSSPRPRSPHLLKAIHLPDSTPLSVLAVELLPGGTGTDVGSPHDRPPGRPSPVGHHRVVHQQPVGHVPLRSHPAGLARSLPSVRSAEL